MDLRVSGIEAYRLPSLLKRFLEISLAHVKNRQAAAQECVAGIGLYRAFELRQGRVVFALRQKCLAFDVMTHGPCFRGNLDFFPREGGEIGARLVGRTFEIRALRDRAGPENRGCEQSKAGEKSHLFTVLLTY